MFGVAFDVNGAALARLDQHRVRHFTLLEGTGVVVGNPGNDLLLFLGVRNDGRTIPLAARAGRQCGRSTEQGQEAPAGKAVAFTVAAQHGQFQNGPTFIHVSSVAREAVGGSGSDLRARWHGCARVAVAGQANPHAHEHLARDLFHRLHFPVATLAGDLRPDMRSMVEVDVVRQGVDALPYDGLVARQRRCHALDFGFFAASDRVAVHAGLHGGNPGVARPFGTGVAVQAGHVVVARMQSVRESDGLPGGIAPRESVRFGGVANREQGRQNRNRAKGQNYAPEAVSWMHAVLRSEFMPDSGGKDSALARCHNGRRKRWFDARKPSQVTGFLPH
jgi:hypothetical protein